MKNQSKKEAQEEVDKFFLRGEFSSEEVKKIKKLAMKYKIKLGKYRRLYCKKCMRQLRGKTRVDGTSKTVQCNNCGFRNRIKISLLDK